MGIECTWIGRGLEPRCENCGKARANNQDIGCAACDPRARRRGAPGPVPMPTPNDGSESTHEPPDA